MVKLILKQISTISAGHPFRGKIPEKAGTGIYAVQMKDVSLRGGIDWQSCIETKPHGRKDDWLQPSDILLAARGSHHYAVLVGAGDRERGARALAAPHFFVIRALTDQVLPEFLAWFLNRAPCRRYFEQNAEGSVTKSIRRGVLDATPIAVPPLDKQQALVGLIKTIRQEQQTYLALVQSNENFADAIAIDLLKE